MAVRLLLAYNQTDAHFASWITQRLTNDGYLVQSIVLDGDDPAPLSRFLKTVAASLVIVGHDTLSSDVVERACVDARQSQRPFFPILVSFANKLPWYLSDLAIADFTTDLDSAYSHLLLALPTSSGNITLGQARDTYLSRATLKSEHTIDSYRRAIELFMDFLADRTISRDLPIQQRPYSTPSDIPLNDLSEQDTPLFLHFAQWMLTPGSGKAGDHRPYKASTIELRLAGIQSWFQFLDDYGWLPTHFKLAKAKRIVHDELRGRPQRSGPPQPPDHMDEIIYYYDTQELPPHLRKPNIAPERIDRWELTRLRNRALLHALAETGGRISEVLSLNLDDFPVRYLSRNEVLRIEVTGKGGHTYYLRFFNALPAIRAYIDARGANLKASRGGHVPLFVSHDSRYDGSRMSRIVAWRVVQRAARALGLKSVTPHDFRHWRATQLINDGHALDVVQEYLGHRSVETTRAYYAHTDPLRVDDAARNTGLPTPEDLT